MFYVQPSGWITTELFTKWFDHILAITKPTAGSPVFLLFYGHSSYTRYISIIDKARQNHVISLPSHSTHKLQPLDKYFLSHLKTYCSQEIRQGYDVIELFGNAYRKCETAEIAISGFKITGMWTLYLKLYLRVSYVR